MPFEPASGPPDGGHLASRGAAASASPELDDVQLGLLYRTLLEQSLDGVLLTRPDGEILHANQAACRKLLRTEEELLRSGLAEIAVSGLALEALLAELRRTGTTRGELEFRRGAGSTFPVHVSSGLVRMPDGRAFSLVVFRDITARVAAELALERGRRALRLLARVNEVIARAGAEEDMLRDVCRAAVEHQDYLMAWIGFAEPGGARRIVPVAHHGRDDGYLALLDLTWADAERGRGSAGTAVRTGQPVVVADIATDPSFAPWRAEALKRGYASNVALPLAAGGSRIGVLGLFAAVPNAFDGEAVELLARLADDLASGIEALRLRAAAAKLAGQLRTAVEVAGLGQWYADLITGEVAASPRLRAMAGFPPDGPAGRNEDWMARVHPDDVPSVSGKLEALLAAPDGAPDPLAWTYRFVHPDGTVRWVESHSTVERDAQGRPRSVLGASLDVTERVREREALRALADRLMSAREEEQARISRDLHDDLGQALTVLQLDLGWIEERLERLPPSPAHGVILDRAVQATQTAKATALAVQRIAAGLRPAALDRLGLPAALRQELGRFGARTGLRTRTEIDVATAELPGPPSIALYRICQEALTNVVRHARAGAVTVRLGLDGDAAVLEVEDDGRGLPAGEEERPTALGLLSMRERARALGGEVWFSAVPGGGTRVSARVPVAAARPPGGAR